MTHRDRAWRRKQRRRVIRNRSDRIQHLDVSKTFARYQLHTEHGEPLPVFRRLEITDGKKPAQLVPVRMKKVGVFTFQRPNWPGGKPGMVWKAIKIYTHEDTFKFGKLAKSKKPKRKWIGRWTALELNGRPIKNWKLMYFRRFKVKRGMQLGFMYPGEKFSSRAHMLDCLAMEEVEEVEVEHESQTEARGSVQTFNRSGG